MTTAQQTGGPDRDLPSLRPRALGGQRAGVICPLVTSRFARAASGS